MQVDLKVGGILVSDDNDSHSLEDFLEELPASAKYALMENWLNPLCKSLDTCISELWIEQHGFMPLANEIAVWHPLRDIFEAPKICFASNPQIAAVYVDSVILGYFFWTNSDVAVWKYSGDISTDADRFFLVQADEFEHVIGWLNEDVDKFEKLGGSNPLERLEHENGSKVLVIKSGDGNALIWQALTGDGLSAFAVIGTVCIDEEEDDEEQNEVIDENEDLDDA